MTIKKRLSISNILMLISPIILTMLLISCLYFVYSGITGINGINAFKYENIFFDAVAYVDSLTKKWTENNDFEIIKADVDRVNNRYNEERLFLMVYKENELVYPQTVMTGSTPDKAILSQEGRYAVINDDSSLYRTTIGEYTIILTDENLDLTYKNPINDRLYIGVAGLIFSIFAIIVINRILTSFVFRGIMMPINIIVNGVHEIRDGNLSYRIQYDNNDEFKTVCSDFNEMAVQLSDMVNARQKDNESRKELIAGISHDLRTPLTSIKAYLEGLEQRVASTPEAQKRYIDIIKGEANDMEHIINQLFQFSKLDTGEFPFLLKPADIGKELNELIEVNEKKYKEQGLEIYLSENVENVYVEIDAVQFRNVIYNILGNSGKYKNKDHAETKITCRENSSAVIITLTDNGPGVPGEAVDKLFDIFYRSDVSRSNPSQGSGLGLAISKKIIECFGGKIYAENVPGGGLSVQISLPKCRRAEKNEENTDY